MQKVAGSILSERKAILSVESFEAYILDKVDFGYFLKINSSKIFGGCLNMRLSNTVCIFILENISLNRGQFSSTALLLINILHKKCLHYSTKKLT